MNPAASPRSPCTLRYGFTSPYNRFSLYRCGGAFNFPLLYCGVTGQRVAWHMEGVIHHHHHHHHHHPRARTRLSSVEAALISARSLFYVVVSPYHPLSRLPLGFAEKPRGLSQLITLHRSAPRETASGIRGCCDLGSSPLESRVSFGGGATSPPLTGRPASRPAQASEGPGRSCEW